MLYGDNPFFGLNQLEIINNIKRLSSNNLPFDDFKNKVSDLSKGLLRSLLEMDPDRRIDWEDFFGHPVFREASSGSRPKSDSSFEQMNQLRQQRGNENFERQRVDTRTNTFFSGHMQNPPLQGLQPPGTIDGFNINMNRSLETEMKLKETQFRYVHEKNVILFIYLTVKKLRQLMKDPDYYELSKYIYLLMLTLAKKGSFLSELNIFSLNQKNNIFQLENFGDFCTNSREYEEIFQLLQDDQSMVFSYNFYINELRTEVHLTPEDEQDIAWLQSSYVNLEQLDGKAMVHLNQMQDLTKPLKLRFNHEENRRYHLAVYMAMLSIHCKTLLPYVTEQGKKLDWPNLRVQLETMDPESLLQCIHQTL